MNESDVLTAKLRAVLVREGLKGTDEEIRACRIGIKIGYSNMAEAIAKMLQEVGVEPRSDEQPGVV